MADADERPTDSARTKAEAMALAEQAEAEAAAAEALATAARARARAVRLRREAEAEAAEAEAAADEPDTQTVEATSGEVTDAGEEPADAETETDAVTEVGEVTDAGETGEREVTPPVPEPAARRRWLRVPSVSAVAKTAAIIVISALLALSGYLVWYHQDVTEQKHHAAAFAAGAKQGVINMTSLDFNRAKEDVKRVIDCSTGEFLAEFQLRAADFTSVVEQSKVVTEGTVTSAAVESMDEKSAVVLVSATSRVTNSAGAKEEPRAWRLRVTVTEEAGQIKMSKVEFVP